MKKIVTTYDLTFAEIESAIKKLFIEKYPELNKEEREYEIRLRDICNGHFINARVGILATLITTVELP